MNDTEFDVVLRAALLEAVREDWASALEDTPPEPEFSAHYQRARAKLLADPFGAAKRKKCPLWKKAAQIAACFLLAAGIAFGGLTVFSPEARAWVMHVITEWRDTHTNYTFNGDDSTSAGVWQPMYVPEGVEVTLQELEPDFGHIVYENQDGTDILFFYMLINQGGRFSIDNEHSDYYQITIANHPADLYISNQADKSNYLIWYNEDVGIAYQLCSQVEYHELIAMAESVKKIN